MGHLHSVQGEPLSLSCFDIQFSVLDFHAMLTLSKWHCHSSEKDSVHNKRTYLTEWYRFHQLETHMNVVSNPLVLTYWSFHTSCRLPYIDCMIEIQIIANPSVSDPVFNQEQSPEHSDGCMTSMLAIVVLGFHQDSIACISSLWAMVGRDRRDKWRKE